MQKIIESFCIEIIVRAHEARIHNQIVFIIKIEFANLVFGILGVNSIVKGEAVVIADGLGSDENAHGRVVALVNDGNHRQSLARSFDLATENNSR